MFLQNYLLLAFGVHVRKALGYVFSLRLQYVYGVAKGLNWKPSYGYANNSAWTLIRLQLPSPCIRVYYNYRSNVQDLSLQGIFTLNNIRFHKQKTGIVLYGGVGVGATIYDTKVNALNGTATYSLISILLAVQDYTNRKDIRIRLKNSMDDTYETDAENRRRSSSNIIWINFKAYWLHCWQVLHLN